jgi:adenosylcobinamide-GDP ribazoletransferase
MLKRLSHEDGERPMLARRFILAVQFLTRIPTPPLAAYDPADLSRSSVFFPSVGAIIGVAVAAAALLGGLINPAVAGLAALLAWVLITGGLHLDGLGDVADAFGAAHRDPERFREVLRDPHAGSFAVIAIVLQVAAKLVLLASLAPLAGFWAIVLIPAWARWGAVLWARTVPSLSPGMGERFAWQIGAPTIGLWALALGCASFFLAPMLLAAFVVVPLAALFWRWRLGGITGDCLGASIEVTESVLLLALLAGQA